MTLPKTPSMRLDGKRALVAGGSSGIGLGCAVALAEAGAEVVVAARGRDALEARVEEMRVSGLKAEALALDVTELDAVRAAVGGDAFDILVNSAGIARHSQAAETTVEDFDAVMGINVRAAYFLAQQVANGMRARKTGGSVIQISSQMGHVGGQERAVYCGTKHAIEGINKAMAIDYGKDGIRFNSICPTFVRTPLSQPTFDDPDKRAWILSKIKLPRVAEVEDLMGACVFLASDAAAMITGTSILVDGGWTAG